MVINFVRFITLRYDDGQRLVYSTCILKGLTTNVTHLDSKIFVFKVVIIFVFKVQSFFYQHSPD